MMTYRQWRVGYLGKVTQFGVLDVVPDGKLLHPLYMHYCGRYRAAHD